MSTFEVSELRIRLSLSVGILSSDSLKKEVDVVVYSASGGRGGGGHECLVVTSVQLDTVKITSTWM